MTLTPPTPPSDEDPLDRLSAVLAEAHAERHQELERLSAMDEDELRYLSDFLPAVEDPETDGLECRLEDRA